MSRISIKLTNEHIALIKNFRFRKIVVNHENSNLEKHISKITKYINEICPEDELIKDELDEQMFYLRRIACASKTNAQMDENRYYGIDTYDFFDNGRAVYSEMSNILGYNDHIIKGSEKEWDGPYFDEETEKHFEDLFYYIFDNLNYIEDIIHQRCDKGGIQADVKYIAYDNERIWYTEEEFKEKRGKRK